MHERAILILELCAAINRRNARAAEGEQERQRLNAIADEIEHSVRTLRKANASPGEVSEGGVTTEARRARRGMIV